MICSSRPEHPHAAHCTKPLTNHDLTSLILHCPTTSSTTSSSACSARFCNRLCLKRSEKVHPWLCPTQDPVSVPLLTFARKYVWMALHALAQCMARLLLAYQQKQVRQRAGTSSRNSEEYARGFERVLRTCGPRDGRAGKERLVRVCICVLCVPRYHKLIVLRSCILAILFLKVARCGA